MEKRRIKSFEDLEVWQHCRLLRTKLSKLARSLPADEKYKLTDQILRAARSVSSNIAEGYGRCHFQENIQFCRQSRGSLYELTDHLVTCFDEGHISEVQMREFREDCQRGIQLVNELHQVSE